MQILDPFTGTGTFLVRLIQSGLIDPAMLEQKYGGELHANELVLLAYYIATVNIETAYHGATGTYRPFDGMILVDTFQMTEDGDLVDKIVLPENNERAARQLAQPIQVIVGNPPYSAQQDSENDDNKNLNYPTLDAKIRGTYAAKSNSKLAKNLYDSYVRAIRWASDRIVDRGIVAYVTNGSFLDANNMDGLRLSLTEEFSHLYVFNLRGKAHGQGEIRRKEGGGIFSEGSKTRVAITIMVKDPAHEGPCELRYHDIGDYLTSEEKLAIVEGFESIGSIPWQRLNPNSAGDWAEQRDPAFSRFVPLGDKDNSSPEALFNFYSYGVVTNRDQWVYDSSTNALHDKMQRMITTYNEETTRYEKACVGKSKDDRPKIEAIVSTDARRISWTRALKADASRFKRYTYDDSAIIAGAYRPFNKQWMYFNRRFNEMVNRVPAMFPTPRHGNLVISSTGVADRKGYSALVTDHVPNMHLTDTGQCFPLYWYERVGETVGQPQSEMFADCAQPDAEGYIRRDAISDWALGEFRRRYSDDSITKEDIFWYVYGILHSPEYKDRFASDLKKMVPRIPYAADFRAFSDAGRELGKWHLGYETVEPYPLEEDCKRLMMEDTDYRVHKMVFGKRGGEKDKSVIVYNPNLTLKNIPLNAYDYVVNGKSALDWVMERYAVSIHKESGIKNDPNDWSSDPHYIVDLVKRIVRVSVETVRIVATLPPLNELE